MFAIRPLVLCGVGVLGVALLGVYLGAAESPTPAVKAPDLSQRVATLEERVLRLEKLLSQQITSGGVPLVAPQVAPQTTPMPQGTAPVPAAPQLQPDIPRNATPFQFNGSTYYIVPLAKDAGQK
jgi:hypothetical protein